jgi:ribosomal protein L7Ae-like RNA K-turn-binding protein
MTDQKPKDKIINLMQFARKAGKLVAGTDACLRALHRGKLYALIITEDTADRTTQKVRYELTEARSGLPVYIIGTQEAYSMALGLPVTGVFGISDKQFAVAIGSCAAAGK